MKYYETTYDEYLTSVEQYNLHHELNDIYNKMPKCINKFDNTIIYGAPGIGKYSQTLKILKKYSGSDLKYDKKITVQNDKNQYTFRISDIHYEIDMSLLGCNSKTLWHDIYLQIVDIISVKSEKIGIIVCKNFHKISSDLLEVFYSYVQQYNDSSTIQLKYIIVAESISFIPSNIINAFRRIQIKRPEMEKYNGLLMHNQQLQTTIIGPHDFIRRINSIVDSKNPQIPNKGEACKQLLNRISHTNILNLKEMHALKLVKNETELPNDVFNIICDTIIKEITSIDKVSFTGFRDALYDILTYNLEVAECIWYILMDLIVNEKIMEKDISDIMTKTHSFLKYYNNNYRPIYHLENMLLYITSKIHNYNEL